MKEEERSAVKGEKKKKIPIRKSSTS